MVWGRARAARRFVKNKMKRAGIVVAILPSIQVHSSVVRAADCRSASRWFKSGCAFGCWSAVRERIHGYSGTGGVVPCCVTAWCTRISSTTCAAAPAYRQQVRRRRRWTCQRLRDLMQKAPPFGCCGYLTVVINHGPWVSRILTFGFKTRCLQNMLRRPSEALGAS